MLTDKELIARIIERENEQRIFREMKEKEERNLVHMFYSFIGLFLIMLFFIYLAGWSLYQTTNWHPATIQHITINK